MPGQRHWLHHSVTITLYYIGVHYIDPEVCPDANPRTYATSPLT